MRVKPNMRRVPVNNPSDPPIRDVIGQIKEKSAQLRDLDERITANIRTLEDRLRRITPPTLKPLSVPFDPWGKLAWSSRKGRWRLVVIDDEDSSELMVMPRLCRADAFKVLRGLIDKIRSASGTKETIELFGPEESFIINEER